MTGRIPQHFIDELLNRVDIVDVINSRVPLKKAGREFHACCPFHNEKTPSFTVSPAKQFYHCFGCGAHGTAIGFLMEYEHLEFPETVEELARSAGMEVPHESSPAARRRPEQTGLYELLEQVDHYYRQQLREHEAAARAVNYLKQRGLDGETAARFGLGFAPPGWSSLGSLLGRQAELRKMAESLGLLIRRDDGSYYDRFRDRIMFPIRDRRGRTIGFGGRVLGDEKPKYMNSPESTVFHKGQELYGLFEARKQPGSLDRLLVVEGYMDVVMLAQHGIGNCVATLGTSTTPEHLQRLFRTVHEVVFCFDGDRAGRKAAWRALENTLPLLREGLEARFLFLPEGEDPDSLVRSEGADAFGERTIDSVPLSEFFYETLAQQVDTRSIDGRARLIELARPYLERLPDSIFRDMMLDRLSRISEIPLQQLQRRLSGQTAPVADRIVKRTPESRHGRSPVRTAIRLLLDKPELYTLIERPPVIADLQVAGVPLLVELLELVQTRPHIKAAGILEHWRGRPEEHQLARLLTLDTGLPENGYDEEFVGAIARLEEQRTEQRASQLLTEGQQRTLSNDEKNELKQLLAGKAPGQG